MKTLGFFGNGHVLDEIRVRTEGLKNIINTKAFVSGAKYMKYLVLLEICRNIS
jgi:hypothetical protein